MQSIVAIFKTNGNDISLDDCALFNSPHLKKLIIQIFKLFICVRISSQGVSDELTSERDFKTFKVSSYLVKPEIQK